jgi:hypothetical protein
MRGHRCRRRVGSCRLCVPAGFVRLDCASHLHRTHQPIPRECTDCTDRDPVRVEGHFGAVSHWSGLSEPVEPLVGRLASDAA